MDEALKLLVSAVLGGLLGGGAIYRLFLGALENRMRATFATRSDLDALGSRVNAFETVLVQARDQTDDNRARLAVIEERNEQQWKRITELLVRPVERMEERIEKIGEEQARQGEALRNLYRDGKPRS